MATARSGSWWRSPTRTDTRSASGRPTSRPVRRRPGNSFSRRRFLTGAGIAALGPSLRLEHLSAQAPRPAAAADAADALLVNGRIHTMDAANRTVSRALSRGGRFAAVGDNVGDQGRGVRRIDLKGRTAIPGIIDAH